MNCGVKQECAIVNHSYTIANRSKCTYSLATCVIAACFAAKKQEKKPKQNPTPNATNAPSLHEKKKAELELRDFALGISQSTQPAEETPKTQMPHPD